MDKKENFAKDDQGKDFYTFEYSNGANYILKPGYISMLKLMWNMASALNLDAGKINNEPPQKLALVKDKIDKLIKEENLNKLKIGTAQDKKEFYEQLEKTMSSTFSLFYPGKIDLKINDGIDLEWNYRSEISSGQENQITVTITKVENGQEEKLHFNITQESGHAFVKHNPVGFNWNEKFNGQDYNFDEAKLLLSYFVRSISEDERPEIDISDVNEFYSAFYLGWVSAGSQESLYKRLKALSVFKTLQNEENNIYRINRLIDLNVMEGAIEIKVNVKGDKTKKDLSDIFYEKFLRENAIYIEKGAFDAINSYAKSKLGEIKNIYSSANKGSQQEIANFEVKRISKNEVILILKNIPEDGNLTIPAKVYDEDGKEFKVKRVLKAKSTELDDLKTVKYDGDFENLVIENVFFGGYFPSDDYNLEKVEFSGKIENLKIEYGAFSNCAKLEKFAIPKTVKNLEIEIGAFEQCENLKTFEILGNVKDLKIENDAFKNCEKLETFKISGTVTNLEIGNAAFSGCKNLKNFEIPGNVKNLKLKEQVFYSCANLETFTISETVTNLGIGKIAFVGCTNLKTLIIPQSVKELSVDKNAFNASRLENLYVPEALKNQIPEEIKNSEKIQIIYYSGANPTKSWRGNWLYLNFSGSIEDLALDKGLLEYYAKQAGFKDISEIQAIQARDFDGKVIEIKLAEDLKKEFSDSQEVLGKIWGTWGKANLKL